MPEVYASSTAQRLSSSYRLHHMPLDIYFGPAFLDKDRLYTHDVGGSRSGQACDRQPRALRLLRSGRSWRAILPPCKFCRRCIRDCAVAAPLRPGAFVRWLPEAQASMRSVQPGLFLRRLQRAQDVCSGWRRNVRTARPDHARSLSLSTFRQARQRSPPTRIPGWLRVLPVARQSTAAVDCQIILLLVHNLSQNEQFQFVVEQ